LISGTEALPGFFLLLLVISGAVRVDCDTMTATLLPGSLFLAPSGLRPRFRAGKGAELKAFSFGASLVDAFASESSMELVVGTLSSPEPRLARLKEDELREARTLFLFLEKTASERRESYLPIVRLKIMELVLLLALGQGGKAAADEDGPRNEEPPRFKAGSLMRYVDEHYSEQFSLADLAAFFALNPSYLSRAFAKETGFTIVEYVNKVRIRKSCVLLKRSESSILEIAFAVGYNSLSHFNKYFRRIMSMSPREYRVRSRR
jgi:AraC-like DNA-binding protein